jgi:hypothetical protein
VIPKYDVKEIKNMKFPESLTGNLKLINRPRTRTPACDDLLFPTNHDYPIEEESACDELMSADLNGKPVSRLADYPNEFTDVGFNVENKNATNRYENAYQTGTVTCNEYDLGRFCEILKRKGTKSRYTPDASQTYGSIAQYQQNNPDASFMRKYNQI